MKAKRRHELKENVLAHELVAIKDFLGKYGNWLLGGVVVVVVVLLVVRLVHSRSQQRLHEERQRYGELTGPSMLGDEKKRPEAMAGLASLASGATDPVVAASAAVTVADLYAQQYLEALVKSADPAGGSEARQARQKAERFYQMVISSHAERKLFAAKAHYGLAVLEVNAGNKAGAAQHYEQVVKLLGPGYPAAGEAETQNRILKDFDHLLRFAPAPASQPATATSPASGPQGTKPAQPVGK